MPHKEPDQGEGASTRSESMTWVELAALRERLPPLMTQREVADLFRIDDDTVDTWSKDDRLPAPVRLGEGRTSRKVWLRDAVLQRLANWAALTMLLLVVAFAALSLGCRLGFKPATDALHWLSRGHYDGCVGGDEHRHHSHSGHLYALGAREPRPRGVRHRTTAAVP